MPNQEQLINKKIELSYWFVTHKLFLKSLLAVLLIIINVCLLAYIVYVLIFNLVVFQPDYLAILKSFAETDYDYQRLKAVSLPQQINLVDLAIYPDRDNFDIVAEIANPAPKWWATFDYQFQIGEKLTILRQGFILPGETKRIMDLNVVDGNKASNVVFSNLIWHKELNFSSLAQERYLFDVQNVNYIPAKDLGVGDKIAISRLNFNLTNNSAFSYKNINLLVFLKSGDQVVGVNQISSGSLRSKETKNLEVTFFQPLPRVTSADIVPEINILDDSVYVKF
jgi:hypothetical protein